MIPALRGLALVALTALSLSVTWGTAWAQTDQAAPAPAGQAPTGNQAAEAPAAQTAPAPAAEAPAAEVRAGQAAEGQTGSQAEAPAANPTAPSPATATPGDEHLVEPDTGMREPERLQYKPSGFWTSGRPAVGGAYRYRLLGIGVAVAVLAAILMIWVVRRHPQRRA